MEASPPDLPPSIADMSIQPDASGLARLPLHGADEPMVRESYQGTHALNEWTARVTAALAGAPRAVLCLEVPSHIGTDAAAACIDRAHAPEHGIAADGGHLFMVLPEGVGWSTVASTAAGSSVTPCPAGLADVGVEGQSVQEAVDLARRASADAVAQGVALVVRSKRDDEAALRTRAIENSLRAALESGVGLRLVYQPKFNAKTREVVGAEALLRHHCEEYGEIPPMEFIGVARGGGLMGELQRWALSAAIDAVAQWSAAGILPFPISVNVAAHDLLADGFVTELDAQIRAADVDPGQLRLEVPEAGILASFEHAVAQLEALHALGVSLALDDFGGAEAPGIADLKRLPIDVLKVHRSFVLGMEAEPSLDALVRGVVTLAGALGIETVAAGVETEAQLAHLAEYGCTAVQGFLLSAPLSRDDFEAQLG